MKTTKVESSMIKTVSYNNVKQTLKVKFNTNKKYDFFDVPIETAVALVKAKSQGEYFNEHIRNIYEYRELD